MLWNEVHFAVVTHRYGVCLRNGPVQEQQVRLLRGKPCATVQCRQYMWLSFCPVLRRLETDRQRSFVHPGHTGAKSNSLFCVKVGTTVQWKSTGRNIGFVVDLSNTSPFDPGGAIIGGTDRAVSVVAKTPGCYKYSAGACMSGAIYGMCGQTNAELVIIP